MIVKPQNTHKTDTGAGKTYFMDGGLIVKDPHAEKIYGKKINASSAIQPPFTQRKCRRSIKTASGESMAGVDVRLSLNGMNSGRK